MNEEEAIEKLKETAKQCYNSKECWENESCCDCYVEVEDIFAIETVLNLIEKQKAEIETLKRDFEIVDHECSRLEQEDIRKDMMINEMVKQIVGLTIFDIEKEEPLILKNEIEVIEYFENKVKESK